MSMTTEVGVITALLYGMISFITPCILPLVPAYITYMTGVDLETLEKGGIDRKFIFLNSVFFVAGFSLVFMLLVIPANIIGNILLQYQMWIHRIAGIIIIVFGLHIAGVITIPILNIEKKMHVKRRGGYIGSLILGITFALGWSPCIGPILASIILIASTESMSTGVLLLGMYSLGLAIPFLVTGLAVGHFLAYYRGILKHLDSIMLVAGLILVFVGGLVFLGLFQRLFSLGW
jgi:cytochrome c-type biogenesis protein